MVFPSGGDEPIYISDWEWMFDIFAKAMDDLGITDGYCYAPYYLGYLETGDLSSGFGGGGRPSRGGGGRSGGGFHSGGSSRGGGAGRRR